MNAPGNIIFFFEKNFSENQGMHDRKDAMFSVIIPFHFRAVGKKRPHSSFSSTSNCRLMGAHNGVEPAVQEQIKQGFVRRNRCNSSRYFRRELNPFLASRPFCAAGEPVNVFGFYSEVFLEYSPDPYGGGHVVLRQADSFPRELLTADDLAVGSHEQRGMAKTSGCKNRQRHV